MHRCPISTERTSACLSGRGGRTPKRNLRPNYGGAYGGSYVRPLTQSTTDEEFCLSPAGKGITRDNTPVLLILQGMTLQLQGIALPSLLTSQGTALQLHGIDLPSRLTLQGTALQLQGIALPSRLTSQGTALQLQGIDLPSLLTLQGMALQLQGIILHPF